MIVSTGFGYRNSGRVGVRSWLSCSAKIAGPIDPDVITIVAAWPRLPEHIRQVIVTPVEAATKVDSAKKHTTLKTTPAVASGLASAAWAIDELIP